MATKQTDAEDQTQRDKINRMDFTITDVVLPALKTIQVDLKTVVQKEYVTRVELEQKLSDVATKDDLKFVKTLLYSVLTAFAIFIMGVATGLIGVSK